MTAKILAHGIEHHGLFAFERKQTSQDDVVDGSRLEAFGDGSISWGLGPAALRYPCSGGFMALSSRKGKAGLAPIWASG